MCDFCIFPPAFEVNYGACINQSVCSNKWRMWSAGQRLTLEWPQALRGHKLSCHFSQTCGQWPKSRGQRSVHIVITGLVDEGFRPYLSTNKEKAVLLTPDQSGSCIVSNNLIAFIFTLFLFLNGPVLTRLTASINSKSWLNQSSFFFPITWTKYCCSKTIY